MFLAMDHFILASEFLVLISKGNIPNAGTNDNAYITMYGDKKTSPTIPLITKLSDVKEYGYNHSFEILAEDVGKIQKIRSKFCILSKLNFKYLITSLVSSWKMIVLQFAKCKQVKCFYSAQMLYSFIQVQNNLSTIWKILSKSVFVPLVNHPVVQWVDYIGTVPYTMVNIYCIQFYSC